MTAFITTLISAFYTPTGECHKTDKSFCARKRQQDNLLKRLSENSHAFRFIVNNG